MKLLYFHQHFSTPNGSTGTRSYEMACHCIDQGHEVVMVCGSYTGGNTGLTGPFKSGKREGIVEGIHVIEFELDYSNKTGFLRRTQLFLIFAFKSIGLAMRLDYDVLFATSTPLTAGIPGIFARWLRRKPFVFEVRDLWPELPRAMGVITNPLVLWLMGMLEWTTYHSANRLIGLSPGICSGIAARGIAVSRIIQISNGSDLALFSNNITPWRPPGIKESDLLFIYSGTFGIANGLNAVLNAVEALNLRGIDGYKIILIGQGREKMALVKRISKDRLENRILILDPVPKEILVGLFKSCVLGMQILDNIPAFYYGTSPNKFFDYLSAGLPVFCNYPGWVSEMITEYECGFVSKPGNAMHFADTIIEILQQRDNLQALGINALRLAKSKFDRSELAREWIKWVLFEKKS